MDNKMSGASLKTVFVTLLCFEISLIINYFTTPKFDAKLFYLYGIAFVVIFLFLVLLYGNQKLHQFTLALFFNLVLIEITFQALTWYNILPGLNMSYSVPYGRKYTTKEGLKSNDVMDRYGWHYNNIVTNDAYKIALIGDSYIEAIQINKKDHLGSHLNRFLNETRKTNTSYQVYAFGLGGIGPAQYLELLKYSIKYFRPNEIIIFIFTGNDFTNVMNDQKKSPTNYITYILDDNGKIALHSKGASAVNQFNNDLEARHKPIFLHIPFTIVSHLITPNILRTVYVNIVGKANKQNTEIIKTNNIDSEFDRVGLDPFVVNRDSIRPQNISISITRQLLSMCKKFTDDNKVTMKLVTIPWFPEAFYTQKPFQWSTEFEKYDLLIPERALFLWANENDVQFLAGAHLMKTLNVNPESIKKMYLADGYGHLSENGHLFFGNLVYNYFYNDQNNDQNRNR